MLHQIILHHYQKRLKIQIKNISKSVKLQQKHLMIIIKKIPMTLAPRATDAPKCITDPQSNSSIANARADKAYEIRKKNRKKRPGSDPHKKR